MNLLKQLIKEALLLEAKENAEFLVKLNYDALKKEHPEMHPKELHKLAKEGPIYSKYIIKYINNLNRPGGYERHFIKWAGDQMQLYGMFNADFIYDWYLGDENAKNILNNISFRNAMENAQVWHGELKQKSFDTDIADEGKTKTVYKFGDGSKIVELSWEDCDAEGTSMGHCVGTIHTELVKDGQEKIFSLRSETNKPHVTISVDPKTNKVLEIKGRENKVPVEKHAKLVKEWLKTTNFDYVGCYDYFSILKIDERKEILKTIKEKNVEEYFNFVIDIVNNETSLTKQDLTKIALGAALASRYSDKILKLLSIIRDWTNGKVSDKDAKRAEIEIQKEIGVGRAGQHGLAAVEAAGAGLQDVWFAAESAAGAIRLANGQYKDILLSIEKETGMPLEDFIFKNEEKEISESLIKTIIL